MVHVEGKDDRMVANNLEPHYLTHPGEVIKDELEYRTIACATNEIQPAVGKAQQNILGATKGNTKNRCGILIFQTPHEKAEAARTSVS